MNILGGRARISRVCHQRIVRCNESDGSLQVMQERSNSVVALCTDRGVELGMADCIGGQLREYLPPFLKDRQECEADCDTRVPLHGGAAPGAAASHADQGLTFHGMDASQFAFARCLQIAGIHPTKGTGNDK